MPQNTLSDRILRLQRLHSLIKRRSNLSPTQLAQKLRVDRTYLYSMIRELESLGARIELDRTKGAFRYQNNFEFYCKST